MKKLIELCAVLALFLGAQTLSAQTLTVTGTVQGDGDVLVGATVVDIASKKGVATDLDGHYSISTTADAVLEFSYLGFVSARETVGGRTSIDVTLEMNATDLDEVVAIGYGVQKKKLNTGASLQVSGADLQKERASNALQALQGKTPGVQITQNSGQPGKDLKLTIRGMGSITNSDPIYVVDGVQTGSIAYLNNSDIESIDILKDAASAAIYGAQAANGVVLITTKKGTAGHAQVSFDGFYGIQNLPNHNVQPLSAAEYATILNERNMNVGKGPLYTDKAAFLAPYGDTDWLTAITNKNAPTYEYSLGVNGGTEQSVYSISGGVTGQDGIFGNHEHSSYDRYTFRANSEHKLYEDHLRIGEHISLAYTQSRGINEGNIYSGSPIRTALGTTPFLPMYDDVGNYLVNLGSSASYTAQTYNGQEWVPWYESDANSVAYLNTGESQSNTMKAIGDVYAELRPIKGLSIKTDFGIDYSGSESRSFTPIYQWSVYSYSNVDKVSQSMGKNLTWNWDNTLSYNFKLADLHDFTVLAGTSARSYHGVGVYLVNTDLIISDFEHAYINNTTNTDISNITLNGYPNDESMTMSYFGRLAYNYQEKYLFTATFRADGSSRFAPSNRWGYFPSFSAGWNISNEDFFAGLKDAVDFLRLRASWGQVGNQNISAWQYLAPIQTSTTNYAFGQTIEANSVMPVGATVNVNGAYPNRLANEGLKWETSEQADLGIDARFLDNRLSLGLDLYNKVTRDWLIQAPVLATAGADAPYVNGGDVLNRGVELTLSWKEKVGDFHYGISGNIAYNHNEVRDIPTESGYIAGTSNQVYNNAAAAYRQAQEGYPIGYFWGYKTDGILQNQAEVDEYVNEYLYAGNPLQGNSICPGCTRFVDVSGPDGVPDGKITEDDKTMIGKPTPDFTFGLSFNVGWKNIDLSVSSYGMQGNDVFQCYRNYGDKNANYTTAILNRWHGEGTSNTLPLVTEGSENYYISDLFVKDGSFLRISNVQLGYDLAPVINFKYLAQARIYVACQNLFCFTAYDGFDPEVGYGTDASTSGFDLGFYPRPRTLMAGVNLKF